MSVYQAFLLICSVVVVGVLVDQIFKRNRRDHIDLMWCDICDCGRRPYVGEENCTCLCHG